MSRLLLAALLAAPAAAELGSPGSLEMAKYVTWKGPKGWRVEEYANGGGADPVVAYVYGQDRLTVRLFGAPGSAYKDAAAFFAGPAATSMGKKPGSSGTAKVAGKTLPVRTRTFPVMLGDPHTRGAAPPLTGRERFVVLPLAEGRFAVLAMARESPAPDLERTGEKAWKAFLASVAPAKRPTRKGPEGPGRSKG